MQRKLIILSTVVQLDVQGSTLTQSRLAKAMTHSSLAMTLKARGGEESSMVRNPMGEVANVCRGKS